MTQSRALAGPAVLGTLAMTYSGAGEPSYVDEEPSVAGAGSSPVLLGVADASEGSPVTAIASLSGAAQQIKVECFGEHGAVAARQIELPAGHTFIGHACAAADADSEPFADVLPESASGPVGMRLTSDGAAGSFAAFAVAPHKLAGDRAFTSVLFTDPQALRSSDTVFTGIPVGPATLLPYGNYTPRISVTNFSASAVHVHTTYMRTAGSAPTPVDAGTVTVPPLSSRELPLPPLGGDADLQNSFVVTSDGAPGAVIAKLVSAGDSPRGEVELQAKDGRDVLNAGGHPWSLEDGTESTLLLFNHGGKTQHFNVAISGSETWQKTYDLQPMQTKAVNIRTLVDDQVKDDTGRALSKTVQSGQASWFVPDSTASSGRLLQSNRATGMARSYSCGYSGLLCGGMATIYEFDILQNEIEQFGQIVAVTCTAGQPNACSGQQTGTTTSYNTSWSSANAGIASIYGSSANNPTSVQGNALGSTFINGRIMSSYCSAGGGGPEAVVPMIQIRASGNKTPGDNLTFGPPSCGTSLGAVTCSGFWGFNIEAVITTPSSVAGYTISQSVVSGFQRGMIKNTTTGALASFSQTQTPGPDNPEPSNLQNQGTGQMAFYIDDPGILRMRDQNDIVDSDTLVLNFQTSVCRNSTGACTTQAWYEKLVVNPGGTLNTASSSVGLGSQSTNF